MTFGNRILRIKEVLDEFKEEYGESYTPRLVHAHITEEGSTRFDKELRCFIINEPSKVNFLLYLNKLDDYAWRINALMGIGCWGKDAGDLVVMTFWEGFVALKAQMKTLEDKHLEMPEELLIFEIEHDETNTFISRQRRRLRPDNKMRTSRHRCTVSMNLRNMESMLASTQIQRKHFSSTSI
jgi:hypothetical protein